MLIGLGYEEVICDPWRSGGSVLVRSETKLQRLGSEWMLGAVKKQSPWACAFFLSFRENFPIKGRDMFITGEGDNFVGDIWTYVKVEGKEWDWCFKREKALNRATSCGCKRVELDWQEEEDFPLWDWTCTLWMDEVTQAPTAVRLFSGFLHLLMFRESVTYFLYPHRGEQDRCAPKLWDIWVLKYFITIIDQIMVKLCFGCVLLWIFTLPPEGKSKSGGWRKARGSMGLTSLDIISILSDVYQDWTWIPDLEVFPVTHPIWLLLFPIGK